MASVLNALVEFPEGLMEVGDPLEFVHSDEIAATHPLEPGLFARHDGIPAHDQELLQRSRVLFVGGGGLNSWAGVGLARSGVRVMTITLMAIMLIGRICRGSFLVPTIWETEGQAACPASRRSSGWRCRCYRHRFAVRRGDRAILRSRPT